MVAVAAAATVMTSCTNEEAIGQTDTNTRVAVKFSSAVANVQTRAANASWAEEDKIGIYMLKSPYGISDISEDVENIQYEATEDTGADPATPVAFEQSGGTTIYYPESGAAVKFIAYYPYTSSGISEYKLSIDVSSQTSQPAIDVLYAATANGVHSKAPSESSVPLQFEHKLVKLVFNIVKEESDEDNDDIYTDLTGLEVTIDDQYTTAKLALSDGTTFTDLSGDDDITALTTDSDADTADAEAIVLPITTTDVTFNFTAGDGTVFTSTVPNVTWVSGKRYTYTVTLGKTEAIITGKITDWIDETGSFEAK
jgi:hypothetical protein